MYTSCGYYFRAAFFSSELLIVGVLFELERRRAGKGEEGAGKGEEGAGKGLDRNFRQSFW